MEVASIDIYILIFFSETTGRIETKLGRNVHWIVTYKYRFFFVDQKYTIETKGPMVSKRVCPYIWESIICF
jgi:hypothetical protein